MLNDCNVQTIRDEDHYQDKSNYYKQEGKVAAIDLKRLLITL